MTSLGKILRKVIAWTSVIVVTIFGSTDNFKIPKEGSGCRYSDRDTLRLLVSTITLLPIIAILYYTLY